MIDDQRSWKGIELLIASMNMATEIDRVSRTKNVGVMLPTSGLFPVAALGAWSLGRTIVPLNYLMKKEELDYIIAHSGCDTVITVQPMLDYLDFELSGVRVLRMEDLPLGGVPEPRWPAGASDEDLAVLLYTSGTSGKPKGVMLTHGNLRANIRQIQNWVHFTSEDTLFGVLPQFHSFGFTVLTLLPLTVGCGVVYSARFVPSRIVKLLAQHRPTALIAIPSMYNALLSVKDASAEDFSSLRFVVSGGEPLPQAVFDQFESRFGKRINEGYGLTETAPVTNWRRPDEFRPGSVGQALPEIDECIINLDTGRALGPNEDGEIRIKGPNIMRGYYRDDVGTRAAFDEAGYFRTGDIGRFDEDGHLYITGRHKEMLIVGGENVFPREIEEVLNRHPSVRASGVVGRAHDVRGEEPIAFVELNEGFELDEGELRAWCRTNIAAFKTPRRVIQLAALPLGATGKVLRRELKAMLIQDEATATK